MKHFPVVAGYANFVPDLPTTLCVIYFESGTIAHVGGVEITSCGPRSARVVRVPGPEPDCCRLWDPSHKSIGPHSGTCFHAVNGNIEVIILDPSKLRGTGGATR